MDLPQPCDEYKQLESLPNSMPIAYGPFTSRIYGNVLGLNLLGEGKKVCSLNCCYCDLGKTTIRMNEIKREHNFATPEEVNQELRKKLSELQQAEVNLDAVLISGNGEPTLYPQLLEVMQLISNSKVELDIKAPFIIQSSGGHIDNRKQTAAVTLADECVIKLDAGHDALFKRMNQPTARILPDKVIASCRSLKDITIQAMFVQGSFSNIGPEDIEDWIEVVGMIGPKKVQLCTFDKIPSHSGLEPVPEDTLDFIASKLRRRMSLEIKVYA